MSLLKFNLVPKSSLPKSSLKPLVSIRHYILWYAMQSNYFIDTQLC